jgi:hypothetical protein
VIDSRRGEFPAAGRWTPCTRAELADFRRGLKKKSVEEIRQDFRTTLNLGKLDLRTSPCRPRRLLIRSLTQIWQELYGRLAENQ